MGIQPTIRSMLVDEDRAHSLIWINISETLKHYCAGVDAGDKGTGLANRAAKQPSLADEIASRAPRRRRVRC